MKKFNILLLFIFTLFLTQSDGQERYLDPVFDDVTVTDSLVYGVNATALYFLVVGEAVPQPLYYNLYEPTGDTLSERPVVLLFHSGTFLPFPDNLQTNGNLGDSSLVDVATKLAKMGYVVASCDYRLGWNPAAPTQDERVFGIMNAAYRAIQDARTAIRYFKYNYAELGNTHSVDTSKMILWGIGTGGYLAMGAASLTDWMTDIAILPKFNVDFGGGPIPVVVPSINGDIYGTSVGISPLGYPFPEGDTLCYENWTGYNSDFQMAVNMGGAIGDTTWVDDATFPTVSFHVPTDEISPCGTALVVLGPPLNLSIVEVSGSCDYQRMQQVFDNQPEWDGVDWDNDYGQVYGDISAVADSRNQGSEGFLPFLTDDVNNNAPWDWWDPNSILNPPTYPSDPVSARATIDSALIYFAPRACITLHLDCTTTSLDEISASKIDLTISPNPATDYMYFTTKEYPMQHILVYDLQGKLVKSYSDIDSYKFEIQRNSLENGVYIAQVKFEHGFISKQIIFQR